MPTAESPATSSRPPATEGASSSVVDNKDENKSTAEQNDKESTMITAERSAMPATKEAIRTAQGQVNNDESSSRTTRESESLSTPVTEGTSALSSSSHDKNEEEDKNNSKRQEEADDETSNETMASQKKRGRTQKATPTITFYAIRAAGPIIKEPVIFFGYQEYDWFANLIKSKPGGPETLKENCQTFDKLVDALRFVNFENNNDTTASANNNERRSRSKRQKSKSSSPTPKSAAPPPQAAMDANNKRRVRPTTAKGITSKKRAITSTTTPTSTESPRCSKRRKESPGKKKATKKQMAPRKKLSVVTAPETTTPTTIMPTIGDSPLEDDDDDDVPLVSLKRKAAPKERDGINSTTSTNTNSTAKDAGAPWNASGKTQKLHEIVSIARDIANIERIYSDEQWEKKFTLLKQYKEEYGDSRVRYNKKMEPKYMTLAKWAQQQREAMRAMDNGEACTTEMTAERRQRLLDLGFSSVPTLDFVWNEKFELLKEYKEEYGDFTGLFLSGSIVPEKYKHMVHFARRERLQLKAFEEKDPKCGSMTDERRQRFLEIGFTSSTCELNRNAIKWEEKFELLKEYKKQYGDCLVRKSPDLDEKYHELPTWVSIQRVMAKAFEKGKTTGEQSLEIMGERRRKLLDLGFEVHPNYPSLNWEERFELLREYKREYGDCNVPKRRNPKLQALHEKYKPLGSWVADQRIIIRSQREDADATSKKAAKNRYKMTKEQETRLLDLGFELDPPKQPKWPAFEPTFQKRYEELQAIKEENGDVNLPGPKDVRAWLLRMRKHYAALQEGKPSPLKLEHIMKLTGLGVQMTVARKRLVDRIREYIDFVKNNGRDPSADSKDEDEYRLAHVAEHIRGARRKFERGGGPGCSKFWWTEESKELISELDSIGFRWKTRTTRAVNKSHRISWDDQLELLVAYRERHGHCEPPKRHPKVGNFCRRQRTEYRKMVEGKRSSMNLDRYRKLSEIGFRFRAREAGISRERFVDTDSSGYDTSDEEEVLNTRRYENAKARHNRANQANQILPPTEDEVVHRIFHGTSSASNAVAQMPEEIPYTERIRGVKAPRFNYPDLYSPYR